MKDSFAERIFLHREKDQAKNLYPFRRKRTFDHRKDFLKSTNSASKGSTSNPLGGKAGITPK